MKLFGWAPQSPDMNPNEHVWAYLKSKLRQRPSLPGNNAELEAALHDEWAKIPFSFITALYDSMPRRVTALMAAKGCCTKY